MKTLIGGGTLYSRGQAAAADLLIEGEAIAATGQAGGFGGEVEVVDARGCHVLPGLIDLHVHIDDDIGRFRLADTWESGSRAALAAGVTTLGGFITQRPGETLEEAIGRATGRAAGSSHCDYLWHLTPTRLAEEDWPAILRRLDAGWRTFKFYTTYRESGLYLSYERLGEAALRLKHGDARILVHAEDEEILEGRRAKAVASLPAIAHSRLRPPEAELRAVERVAEAAEQTGAWFHIVHVSTPEAAEAVGRARRRARITCETAPHYLFLDDSWLRRRDGHRWLCTPPLRDAAARLRLRGLAREGAFETFATDHCAFSRADKDLGAGDMRLAPMGVAGIGSLPRLVFELNRERPERAFSEMSLRLAENPARLAGIEDRKGALAAGMEADVAVFEVAETGEPLRSGGADSHETFPGFASPLRLRHLFRRGRQLVRDGAWIGKGGGGGRCLWPN